LAIIKLYALWRSAHGQLLPYVHSTELSFKWPVHSDTSLTDLACYSALPDRPIGWYIPFTNDRFPQDQVGSTCAKLCAHFAINLLGKTEQQTFILAEWITRWALW